MVFENSDAAELVIHYRDAVKSQGAEHVAIVVAGRGTSFKIDYSQLKGLVNG